MTERPIVSLAPSATATIAAMGQADRLVGVTAHCPVETASGDAGDASEGDRDTSEGSRDASEGKPTDAAIVGGWLDPAYDRIRELDPAIVCTTDELQRGVRDELRDRGHSVVHLEPSRLSEVVDGFATLGEAVGAADAGARLAERSRERLAAVQRQSGTGGRLASRHEQDVDDDRPVVYCEEWSDPPMAAGNWVPEAVIAAGGRYPFVAPGERSREISGATVEAADPDHAVLHVCGFGDRVSPDRIADRDWRIDPEVHVVDDSLLNQPSPRLLDGIELLAERLRSGE